MPFAILFSNVFVRLYSTDFVIADISMARKYVPTYTRKLALNSSEEQRVDEGKGIFVGTPSFLARFRDKTTLSELQNDVKVEPERSVTEIPGNSSETYLRRISNAKRALAAQERLNTGYKRGLPRFLTVCQEDYKPQTNVHPRANTPGSSLQPFVEPSRQTQETTTNTHTRGLRETSFSKVTKIATLSTILAPWTIVCIAFVTASILLVLGSLAGARESIYDIIWHAQMRQLGLHPPYYLVEKTTSYL